MPLSQPPTSYGAFQILADMGLACIEPIKCATVFALSLAGLGVILGMQMLSPRERSMQTETKVEAGQLAQGHPYNGKAFFMQR